MLDISANFSRIIAILAVCMIIMSVVFTIDDNASRTALIAPLVALLGIGFAFLFAKNGQENAIRQIEYRAEQKAEQVAHELVQQTTTKPVEHLAPQDNVYVEKEPGTL